VSNAVDRANRLVLVSSSLGGGGAERIVSIMASHWSQHGWEVHVVSLLEDQSVPDYGFPAEVRLHRLRLVRERNPLPDAGHLLRLWRLRRHLLLLQPTCVISFLDKLNVAVLLALIGTEMPVLATEHVVPWLNPLGGAWETLRHAAYRRACAIACPTQSICDWFEAKMTGNFVRMPFPAELDFATPRRAAGASRTLFAAGRLAGLKGHDLLLAAFALVARARPGWRLEIAGEGPERRALEAGIAREKLQSSVALLGHVGDVSARMRAAEIFVHPSRQDAYALVLCEAMAAGAAVVAADCPTGPREILTDGVDGVLVPPEDPAALAEAIIRLIDDPVRRDRLGSAARAKAPAFSVGAVMPAWDRLLSEDCARRG
jgi:GalNAc-alpha-(1->4)-GalNAc-alpha-(1->3)-diNAcBac-PP-undecaprenol alpha-1,4-N-acetyl-D-galactosaminyltransferase